MPYDLTHSGTLLGTISTLDDVRALRESIRGKEFRYGVISNSLDFVLSGDEGHLAYLSPRDRREAETEAERIRGAIGSGGG